MLTAAEIAAQEHNIDHVWSLADYLSYMNEQARAEMAANPGLWVSEFTEELEHWAEAGIHTARDLADYLDACFQRELQKSQYDMWEKELAADRKAQAQRDNDERRALKNQYVNTDPVPNDAMYQAFCKAFGVQC